MRIENSMQIERNMVKFEFLFSLNSHISMAKIVHTYNLLILFFFAFYASKTIFVRGTFLLLLFQLVLSW